MKKIFFLSILFVIMAAGIQACDLIEPREIISPNVDEESFLGGNLIMNPWVNGMQRDFATTMGTFVELTEIISDNYFNDYTQSSKVFDRPLLDYNDIDVTNLQRLAAKLRESADYGIYQVAVIDETTTEEQLYHLKFIRAFSFLMGGEYFTGLPMEVRGKVEEWQTNLNVAINEFKPLLPVAAQIGATEVAALNTIIARAYYRLGDKTNAVSYANAALAGSTDFVRYVEFDGTNNVSNSMQNYIFGNPWFQPLPRLDFLDPKYFAPIGSPREHRPIAIAKAEEPYLILAEALLADHDITAAAATLKTLLQLVSSRPTLTINNGTQTRGVGLFVLYPNSAEYRVAASAADPLRSGLVLTRNADEPLVTIPYISGTSVDDVMIDNFAAQGEDKLLELLYLMRQEIFIAEARRICDLGIRLPVCFREFTVNPTAEGFTEAQIPPFIPLDQKMDSFIMDQINKTIVIEYNMNRVIAQNKQTQYVVPFVK